MTAVIYARFSSHSQTEQSIEGQLKTCYDYAAANKITIVGEFIDRAQSGTNDNRTEFQRMIATSERHTFDTVLVYQLDRFARNRYDSAINKAKLKKNGVRVISARENIADDASGILVEGVLESMAEYYSAELSQKIRRGMDINGEKCLSTGSNPGLGFRVDDEKRIVLDPDTAPVVRTIFEQYVAGDTIKDITDRLNSQGVQTSKGGLFNKNSLRKLLSNRRYLGIYIYKGKETPGAIPRIIDDDLFERAQARLEKSKKAPAQAKAKAEYLLTTKLFCGHCREMMTGYAGTSKTGTVYHYYICNGHKAKVCTKKNVRKEYIEALLVQKCREQLTDENIQIIAKEVAAVCAADYDTSMLKHLRTKLKEVEKGIENLLLALESGQAADIIAARISQRSAEKAELERQISIEMQGQIPIDEKEILFFLYSLQKGAADNDKYRKMLINIFLVAAYLYDDKLTYILTVGGETITVTKSLMDAIDESNAGFLSSFFNGTAPPTFQLIPPDNRWYLLFSSCFCNRKYVLKISVDIPVDYGFELMIHYKQGTPKAKIRKPEMPATDTGIRSSGAACAPLRRPLYQRKDGEHKCPARAWSATSRLTTRKRNTMSIWISGATRADTRSRRPAPLPV